MPLTHTHTHTQLGYSFLPTLGTCHPEVRLKWWRQGLLILDPPSPSSPPSPSICSSWGLCDVTAIHSSHAFLLGSYPSHLLFERADRWQIPSPFSPSHSLHCNLNQGTRGRASCILSIFREIILLWTHSCWVCICVQATTAELNPNELLRRIMVREGGCCLFNC